MVCDMYCRCSTEELHAAVCVFCKIKLGAADGLRREMKQLMAVEELNEKLVWQLGYAGGSF